MTGSATESDSENPRPIRPGLLILSGVLLASVIAALSATYVLGLGDVVSTSSPDIEFDRGFNEPNLTFTHAGGDSVPAGQLRFTGDTEARSWASLSEKSPGELVEEGDQVTLSGVGADSVIRIIWASEAGTKSAVVLEWRSPAA